jgi:hypothetical protein
VQTSHQLTETHIADIIQSSIPLPAPGIAENAAVATGSIGMSANLTQGLAAPGLPGDPR